MNWTRAVLDVLVPAFGGVPTFCEDPDGLLEEPGLREALRTARMQILDWNGDLGLLEDLKAIEEVRKPLIVVADNSQRYRVEKRLPHHRWVSVSIGSVFPRFFHEIVRSIPRKYWNQLYELHQRFSAVQPVIEPAIQIARSVYGVDPLYLTAGDGWIRLLIDIVLGNEGLPGEIAVAVHRELPEWLRARVSPEGLSDPARCRGLLGELTSEGSDLKYIRPANSALLTVVSAGVGKTPPKQSGEPKQFFESFPEEATPAQFLAYGLRYSAAAASGLIPTQLQVEVNTKVVRWLESNYALAQTSASSSVLRLTTLVRDLDELVGDAPLLLVIIDGMGLPAWHLVESVWKGEGLIESCTTGAAFAVLPTVTSLSRRAIFEGKQPVQFVLGEHSSRLERALWQNRFPLEGAYFSAKEQIGIADAISLRKQRLCVVDTTWDERSHCIMPPFDSLEEAAVPWAARTVLKNTIVAGLNAGYRVFLTSDHGQVLCEGQGRPHAGELVETRSKRVLLFRSELLQRKYVSEKTIAFKPVGLPSDCWPLYPREFAAFDLPGVISVSHGGPSLEEVLVPVVEVHPLDTRPGEL